MYEKPIIPDELKEAAASMDGKKKRYCVLEDMNAKNYLIFDTVDDWKFMIIPFGDILFNMLNCFIDSSEVSVYHSKLLKYMGKETAEEMAGCKPMYESLLDIITHMEANSTYPDKTALKCAYIREWKKYRYINCVNVFRQFASYFSDDVSIKYADYVKLYGSIEELRKTEEEELQEINATLHSIIIKDFFIPYDTVYMHCESGWLYGKTWFTSDVNYVFSRELYHLFVDNTIEQPHICPRCGHLYYSNNNKSKYCDSCKNNYSDIRKEYRKKNQARYIHKRINDKLHSKRYSEEELDKFMIESNFYWDIVKKKEPKTKPESWYLNISTEEEYKNWLESKLNEYSARK